MCIQSKKPAAILRKDANFLRTLAPLMFGKPLLNKVPFTAPEKIGLSGLLGALPTYSPLANCKLYRFYDGQTKRYIQLQQCLELAQSPGFRKKLSCALMRGHAHCLPRRPPPAGQYLSLIHI